jgi:hypothetical protein
MAMAEFKTAAIINQRGDEEDDVCLECGSKLEDGTCPGCDTDGGLDEDEPSLETGEGEEDENWIN